MAAMKIFMMLTFLAFSLIFTAVSFTTARALGGVDFCVADPSVPYGPSGYSCKDPSQATANDFFYNLSAKGNTSNVFRVGVTPATPPEYAGVNGLGISMARLDVEVGGAVPMHTHPRATEIIVVIKGTIIAGFVAPSTNQAYLKTLRSGEVFVFPPGLLHFQVNVGKTPVMFYSSFNSADPGLQVVSFAFFENDLPSKIVSQTTLISEREVQRLKKVFGGTN